MADSTLFDACAANRSSSTSSRSSTRPMASRTALGKPPRRNGRLLTSEQLIFSFRTLFFTALLPLLILVPAATSALWLQTYTVLCSMVESCPSEFISASYEASRGFQRGPGKDPGAPSASPRLPSDFRADRPFCAPPTAATRATRRARTASSAFCTRVSRVSFFAPGRVVRSRTNALIFPLPQWRS